MPLREERYRSGLRERRRRSGLSERRRRREDSSERRRRSGSSERRRRSGSSKTLGRSVVVANYNDTPTCYCQMVVADSEDDSYCDMVVADSEDVCCCDVVVADPEDETFVPETCFDESETLSLLEYNQALNEPPPISVPFICDSSLPPYYGGGPKPEPVLRHAEPENVIHQLLCIMCPGLRSIPPYCGGGPKPEPVLRDADSEAKPM